MSDILFRPQYFRSLCTVGSWPVTLNADQALIPLTVFRSGSGFDRGLGCFGLGCARPIVGRFCTHRDRYTVVVCARFRCDRWGMF